MKISKLFHWLYAIIMLLPVGFIAGRSLYTIFNKNAKDSYSLYDGTYNIKLTQDYTTVQDELITISAYQVSNDKNAFQVSLENATYIDPQIIDIWNLNENDTLGVIQLGQGGTNGSRINLQVNGGWVNKDNLWGQTIKSLNFRFNSNVLIYINVNNGNYIALVNKVTQGTLDNAFEYSVNQLNEVPLFSWAKDSFIVTPFAYITGLFGVQSDSPINTLFSYWLSISICWLVFDLLMYVPLLAHRWLDKGVIE